MHTNIIDGGTKETRGNWVTAQTTRLTNLVHVSTEKSSITIKQIQELLSGLITHSPIPRVIWIEEANLLTLPAQNTLLKSLEEPPSNTTFYLTCQQGGSLLPTIRSRSTTLHLTLPKTSPARTHLPLIKSAMSATSGARLSLASEIPSDRTEAKIWFEELLSEIATTLAQTQPSTGQSLLVNLAKNAELTRSRLLANCSVGLTTQNFFLHLPKTRL